MLHSAKWQKVLVGATVGVMLMVMPLMGFVSFGDGAFADSKISEDTLYFNGLNGIYFYNPNEGSRRKGRCPAGSYVSGPIAIVGSTVKEKIWNALIGFMTEEQAAGVMGNMQSESNFNPAQHEVSKMNELQPGFDLAGNSDVSYGLGLAQWSFDRRIALYNYVGDTDPGLLEFFDDYQTYSPSFYSGEQFMALAGENATDALLSLEIQYLKDEVDNSYSGIYEADSVYEATKYWLENFERPQNPQIEYHEERVTQAEAIYDEFADGGSVASGDTSEDSDDGTTESGSDKSSTVGTVCDSESGVLEEYVKRYAWPDYRKEQGVNYTNRMPDYADAVTKRQSEGKYVGGTVDGVAGIDCGGFVTTIMQESGYEPGYNGCNSNVATQEYWVREGDGAGSWEWLNPDGETMDAADLQLGDVAFQGDYTGGCVAGGDHTYMFIGNIEGFSANVVSASYDSGNGDFSGRAPMAGYEGVEGVRWYRKVK